MSNLADPPIEERGGRIAFIEPDGRIVKNLATFCRMMDVNREAVNFNILPFDPWEFLAAVKRAYEASPPTLCTLAPATLYRRATHHYGGDLPDYDRMMSYIGPRYLRYIGLYTDPEWQEPRWVNPHYCHTLPQIPRGDWPDELIYHFQIGSRTEDVTRSFGCTEGELRLFCRKRWGYEYHDLAASGRVRRRNSVALSVEWGTDPETIAFVEGVDADRVHTACENVEIHPDLPDPTVNEEWWS